MEDKREGDDNQAAIVLSEILSHTRRVIDLLWRLSEVIGCAQEWLLTISEDHTARLWSTLPEMEGETYESATSKQHKMTCFCTVDLCDIGGVRSEERLHHVAWIDEGNTSFHVIRRQLREKKLKHLKRRHLRSDSEGERK
jgi:hypothetical protein